MIKIFEGDHIKISVPIDETSTLQAENLKFLLVIDSELGVKKPCAIEDVDGVKSIVVVLEEPDTVGLNGYYIYEIRHMLDGAEKVIAQSSIIIRNSFIVDEEYIRPDKPQKITELIDRIKVIEEGIANNYSNEDKERVDKILIDGDGSKYLSDDGTYKTIDNVDLSDYYNKGEVDNLVNFDLSNYYTKNENDTLLSNKANKSNTYTKSEVNNLVDNVDLSDYYNKSETDNLLNDKVSKVSGKSLSSNDFTNALKDKLDGLSNYDDTPIKSKVDKLVIDGDGSKYLANDGTYKSIEIVSGSQGADGKSAYQVAQDNGFTGSEAEWFESLKGQDGTDGQDGTNGINGTNGTDGKSAYQLWLDSGNNGTLQDFLVSLKGEKGKDGINGQDGVDGKPGAKGEPGLPGKDGSDGINGTNGKSAYEIATDNGFTGSEAEWLNSLKGVDGQNGTNGVDGTNGENGKSAYELAVESGFSGSKSDWLNSLKGDKTALTVKTEHQ